MRVSIFPFPLLWHLTAKHLKHQRGELHAMLWLEGERAVLLGVLLVQAAQVGKLLDHLGVEEASPGVVDPDVGLQRLRQMVLELFDAAVVLDAGTVCRRRGRVKEGGQTCRQTGVGEEGMESEVGRWRSGKRNRTWIKREDCNWCLWTWQLKWTKQTVACRPQFVKVCTVISYLVWLLVFRLWSFEVF